MEIILYLLFLSAGFGLGLLFSISHFARRIDGLRQQPITVPTPQVQINVSAELVARYLDSFNLVAIPKHLVIDTDEAVTKH